jgi:hypothetical protein
MNALGDVVAIHINNQPSIYARIEAIEPDIKPRWFQVKLLLLSFPPQEVSWILRREYLEGSPFTMNDTPVQIFPVKKAWGSRPSPLAKGGPKGAEVISMSRARDKKANGKKTGPDDGDPI